MKEKRLVVCIDSDFVKMPFPLKGDICEVVKIKHGPEGKPYYQLAGFNQPWIDGDGKLMCSYFACECFRDIDDTFGIVVCETLEEVLELEEATV